MRKIARRLFKDFDDYKLHDDAKNYLQSVLMEKVRTGNLYLTEILLQPEANTVGEVLFGLGRDENTKSLLPVWPTPKELLSATVHLQSCDYDPSNPSQPKKSDRPITYKNGMKQEDDYLLTASTMGPAVNGSAYRHMVDNVIDLGVSDANVPLRDAWQILKQKGFGVREAKRQDHRQRAWLVYEVPPEEKQTEKRARAQ